MEKSETIQNLIRDLNTLSGNTREVMIQTLATEHRTLQQSFTKLCLEWLEYCGSDKYHYDLRNQDTHEVCKSLLENFSHRDCKDFKPSQFLRTI
jgi:hypothetical protein